MNRSKTSRSSKSSESSASALGVDGWLSAHVAGYPDVRLCVALSGGIDSAALLVALAEACNARPRSARPTLRALHVDHHLHPDSGNWSRHCSALARRWRVKLAILDAAIARDAGRSLEAQARVARYALLRDALQDGEVLLTAHHADDQLETVLLQLLRGAGLRGLSAMPKIAPFGRGFLARPLLSVTRASILEWARSRNIDWVEDATNADERFDRNYLRRRVLPLLRDRWPAAAEAAGRTARHAAQGQRLLDALARADVERAADGEALSAGILRTLDIERRRNALRYWIAARRVTVPDARRLAEIAGPMLAARSDANPIVAWGEVEIRRHGDRVLLAQRTSPMSEEQLWEWKVHSAVVLPQDLGTLQLAADPRGPIDLGRLPDRVSVRWRAGGEYLKPKQGGPRRSLKSLLQTAKIPPHERERLPLVFDGERVLAVGDRWVDVSIQALEGARERSRLIWRRLSD